jgi:hypothetical protein
MLSGRAFVVIKSEKIAPAIRGNPYNWGMEAIKQV